MGGVSVQELSYPIEQTILYLISSVNGSEFTEILW
jgi:hypothetical protein